MKITVEPRKNAGACINCVGRLDSTGYGLLFDYNEVAVISTGGFSLRLCRNCLDAVREQLDLVEFKED